MFNNLFQALGFSSKKNTPKTKITKDKSKNLYIKTEYNSDNSIKSTSECKKVSGKKFIKHGQEVLYTPENTKIVSSYVDDEKSGPEVEYNSKNVKIRITDFSENKKHGVESVFNDNGEPVANKIFYDGKLKNEELYSDNEKKYIEYSNDYTFVTAKDNNENILYKDRCFEKDLSKPYTGLVNRHDINSRQDTFAVFINGHSVGNAITVGRGGDTLGNEQAQIESYRQNCLFDEARDAQRNGNTEQFNAIFEKAMHQKELLGTPEFDELLVNSYEKAMVHWKQNKKRADARQIFNDSMQNAQSMTASKASIGIEKMKDRLSEKNEQQDAKSESVENNTQQSSLATQPDSYKKSHTY